MHDSKSFISDILLYIMKSAFLESKDDGGNYTDQCYGHIEEYICRYWSEIEVQVWCGENKEISYKSDQIAPQDIYEDEYDKFDDFEWDFWPDILEEFQDSFYSCIDEIGKFVMWILPFE